MNLGSVLLWLTAAFFVVYGALFVFAPGELGRIITGSVPATPSAWIDMRATYGGMTVAVGLVLAGLARDPRTHALGLRCVALVMFCMAAPRALGMALDGSPNGWMVTYLALEIAVMSLALWAAPSRESALA